MLKGALHVHSTYSDGEFTLAELREIYLTEGCSFVCMPDHAEHLDSSTLPAYVQECKARSDEKLRFVAGLEYECERRMHILGYGATKLADATDPQAVIRHIDRQDAVSVIALLAEFGKAHDRSNSMWRFLKSAKSALDRMGIPVPQSLKSHLRRIF